MVMMSTHDDLELPSSPEILGKRVLVTGVSHAAGVDIVRAFADRKARLILHISRESAELQALAEIAARSALDMRLFNGDLIGHDGARLLARSAAQAFGGLDLVVNIVDLDGLPQPTARTDIEQQVADLLAAPYLISRIAANRMRLTMTAGLIVNVVLSHGNSGKANLLAAVVRSTLIAMTRKEAEAWASEGIRFNAVTPLSADQGKGPDIKSEPALADLILHLISRKGRTLTGLAFTARL